MKLNPSTTAIVKRLLVGRNNRPLQSILSRLEPADLASLFGLLNSREARLLLEALFSIDRVSVALMALPEAQLENVLKSFEIKQLETLTQTSTIDEAAYFLSFFDDEDRDQYLQKLPAGRKTKVIQYLNYPEDSAGWIMQASVFCLPAHLSAKEGLEELRKKAQEESIYYIYCVNDEGELLGVISLRQLATAPQEQLLKNIAKTEVVSVNAETPSEEVAELVAHYDFIAIPVIDENRHLLGVITVDDVLDIIQEQATANIYAQAGLQEDDRVYTTIKKSIKNRLPWMFLNLFLAALASSVLSLFEQTMHELILLAVTKNMVGIGGNTAIQSLTVVTRGLATGDFKFISYSKAVIKEVSVGFTVGILTGLGGAILVYFWKGDPLVSVVIFISMALNSVVASSFGALVPIGLKRLNFDPATGSGVIVTTMTDIFSFFSFLGIATVGLQWMS